MTPVNHATKRNANDALLAVAMLLATGITRSRLVGPLMQVTPHALLPVVGDMAVRAAEAIAEYPHPNRGSSYLELSGTADLHPALAVDASQKREVR